jgi:ribonuclease R
MHNGIDFAEIARRAMVEHGFLPEMGEPAMGEVAALRPHPHGTQHDHDDHGVRDLRRLLWSSIDNDESRDLDQIEVCERVSPSLVKIMVGIADVDSYVAKGSALDRRAAQNTTSVYTGVVVFPMLPAELSTNLSSLNPGEDRLAIVIEMLVGDDGEIGESSVYRALVHNHAKLAYDDVERWLGGFSTPQAAAGLPELAAQIRMQDEVAQQLRRLRHRHGALELETIEAQTIAKNGEVVGLTVTHKTRSREIIEDLMIASNGVIARFLEAHDRSSISRVVRKPKRWDRIVELAAGFGDVLPAEPDPTALSTFLDRRHAADPLRFGDISLSVVKLLGPGEYTLQSATGPHVGHFGLAVQDYSHSTAPNRRFADLVTQRLLKSTIANAKPAYDDLELDAIARHCTQKEDDARKVERTMRKVAAAALLASRVGETFDAVVTGVASKGTFVRLLAPPAEGRVVRGEQGMDVGDAVRVKLVATEPAKGFIDFVRA